MRSDYRIIVYNRIMGYMDAAHQINSIFDLRKIARTRFLYAREFVNDVVVADTYSTLRTVVSWIARVLSRCSDGHMRADDIIVANLRRTVDDGVWSNLVAAT